MQNPESVQENEMPDLMIIKKQNKKIKTKITKELAVPAKHWTKLKESKKRDE